MEKRTVNFIMNDNDKSVCAELQETYLRMRAELEATAQKFCRCVTDMEKLSMSTTVTADKAHWNKVISMDAQMQSLNAMFVHNVCTYLENRYRVTICRNDVVNELINDSAMARSLTSKQVVEKASAYTIIKSRIKANPAEKTKQISVAEIFVPQPATAEKNQRYKSLYQIFEIPDVCQLDMEYIAHMLCYFDTGNVKTKEFPIKKLMQVSHKSNNLNLGTRKLHSVTLMPDNTLSIRFNGMLYKRQFERFFRENIETFREGTFVTEPVDTVSVKN